VAHNPRVRADLTAWTAAIPLEPSELDALDEGQFAAINGDDGGTWAPANPIVIGGAGIEFTGAVPVGEDLSVPGTITVPSGGAIDVESGGNVNVESGGNVNVAGGGHLHCSGEIHIDDGGRILLQDGGFLFEYSGSEHVHASGSTDTYESGSELELDGNVTVSASAKIDEEELAVVNEGATYTQTGPRYLSGAGRIQQRVVVGPDAGANYDGSVADVVIIPAATLSGDRTYVLNIGATRHGQRITFINYTTNHGILFSSSGTIYRPVDYNPALLLMSASGYVSWVEFMYSDGESGHPPIGWHVIQYRVIP
jgi:hypothetical protein